MSASDPRLLALGWRHGDSADAKAFQAGWGLEFNGLTVDGIIGPLTSHALSVSVAALHAGTPTASPHFSFTEFQCACGGRFADCQRILVRRELLGSLEALRAAYYPHGLTIVSGYRCPQHNAQVGGVGDSQHVYGTAADVTGVAPVQTVEGLHIFAGIGSGEHDRKCHHVDRRDLIAEHDNGGTLAEPILWTYPWA